MAVTMKQDYAASEVYSTTSEAPPAYKIRQANSVKIARIVAVTVILSSFILGSFMLASTYLQAKQSCDQMQTLDAVLNKELMLEAMQQELPKAQALMQDNLSADEANLQTIDREEKKPEHKPQEKKESAENTESEDDDDSAADGESDETADMNSNNRVRVKMPMDLDLTELAHTMLRENQKSKMNCVVERRRTEELVDTPAKTMRLPFGMEFNADPKKQKVTGERIAIFCETGNEPKNEDAEPVRQVLIPIPPVRSFGGPITHLPQQMPPQPIMRQMARPMFPIQMMNHQQSQQMPPIPAQMMQAPHPEGPMMRPNFQAHHQPMMHQPAQPQQPQPTFPQQMQPPRAEVRIQFQRIPIPEAIRPFLPPQALRNGPEQNDVQIREVPLEMALQKVGLSADELKDIHEIAAQKFTEQLKQLIGEMADSEESDEETDSYRTTPAQEPASQHSEERELQEQQPPRPQEPEPHVHNLQPQILPMGRAQYARSLVNPINLPGKVVESSVSVSSDEEAERPHYVQPRSV